MTGQSDTISRDFFDTNILVYGSDDSEPEKQAVARDLLEEAVENGSGVLSAQVLGELFNSVTRRIRQPLSIDEAKLLIEKYSVMPIVELDLALVRQAVAICGRYQVSYWDALIIAAAERAGCGRIISEDMNPGQLYHGVVVVNPFMGGS